MLIKLDSLQAEQVHYLQFRRSKRTTNIQVVDLVKSMLLPKQSLAQLLGLCFRLYLPRIDFHFWQICLLAKAEMEVSANFGRYLLLNRGLFSLANVEGHRNTNAQAHVFRLLTLGTLEKENNGHNTNNISEITRSSSSLRPTSSFTPAMMLNSWQKCCRCWESSPRPLSDSFLVSLLAIFYSIKLKKQQTN